MVVGLFIGLIFGIIVGGGIVVALVLPYLEGDR
jgi:hypothetical protein